LGKCIEIKCYDVYAEIKGTPFENMEKLHFSQYADLPMRADTFRAIVLYKYGGIYFDLDMFFLRDISGLCKQDFFYYWEKQPFGNNALLFLNSNSNRMKFASTITSLNTFCPWVVYNYDNPNLSGFMVYPCTFFDPIWMITSKDKYDYPIFEFKDFFTNQCTVSSYKDFFPGAYAFHWHNRWDLAIVPGSFFDVFDKEISHDIRSIKTIPQGI
jgi:hypothetical protein